jgi:hypothetical protein
MPASIFCFALAEIHAMYWRGYPSMAIERQSVPCA